MKIIEQSHEIISIPDNLLQVIETAGRTCYKSEYKIGCAFDECQTHTTTEDWHLGCQKYSCEYHSSQKFTKMLLNRGHHAMIEFGDIIVRFVTNRGVTHELVRHRMCSFAQESTRYVRYDGQMEFIKPVWIEADDTLGEWSTFQQIDDEGSIFLSNPEMIWLSSMLHAEIDYRSLLKNGWKPQQAREVLSNSLKTEIMVKANSREWRHILILRCAKAAHPQMRALMLPLLSELQKKVPVIFDDI